MTTTTLPAQDTYALACEANNAYRRMRMNVKYYGARLVAIRRNEMALDCLIAVGTSTTIGSLLLFQSASLRWLPMTLAAIAAVLSVLKPLLGYARKADDYNRLWSTYNRLHNTLGEITRDMSVHRQFRSEMEPLLQSALKCHATFANDEDPSPDKKLLIRMRAETAEEIPSRGLWWPEGCEPWADGAESETA